MSDISGSRRIAATVVGYLTVPCLMLLLLPQLYTTYKKKDTKGLSLGTIAINFILSTLGIVYGILIEEIPLIIGNSCVFVSAFSILVMFYMYRKPQQPKHDVIELAEDDII